MNKYYIVPTSFTSFNDVVEIQLTRIATDNSEAIVKTAKGVTQTPQSLSNYTALTLAQIRQHIVNNPTKYPIE